MVDNISFIKRHMKKYPFIETMDIYKMIFQSIYKAGHIINERTLKYLEYEQSKITLDNAKELYEYISNDIVRVNLESYLSFYSLSDLYALFKSSTKQITKEDDDNFTKLITLVKNANIVENKVLNKLEVKAKEELPVHSNMYKNYYDPHYRICLASLLSLDLKCKKLQMYLSLHKKATVFSLEGRCASGKTTISKMLENVTVLHCDDYFTENEPLDFIRLKEDIENIKKLMKNKSQSDDNLTYKYTAYDCHSKSYYQKEVVVKDYLLVEGVFSYHQNIRESIDKLLFMVVTKDVQNERLMKRNKDMYDKFIRVWIPREEQYYSNNKYIEYADELI